VAWPPVGHHYDPDKKWLDNRSVILARLLWVPAFAGKTMVGVALGLRWDDESRGGFRPSPEWRWWGWIPAFAGTLVW